MDMKLPDVYYLMVTLNGLPPEYETMSDMDADTDKA